MRRTTKILFFLFLILLLMGGFFGFVRNVFADNSSVNINEFLYYANSSGDTGQEWIEFYNNGGVAVNMTGYDLYPDGIGYYTFPSFTLDSHAYVVIHLKKDGIDTKTDLYQGETSKDNMSNTSGSLALFNSKTHNEKTMVDFVQYGKANQTFSSDATSAEIWNKTIFLPLAATGKTLEFKKDGVNDNSPENWQESFCLGGSPGKESTQQKDCPKIEPPKEDPEENEIKNYSGKLKINEIFPAPKDKNAGQEFVEIINLSSENISLSGMRIEDEKNHKVFFPDKVIAPKELLYLEGNFELNNTTPDTAFLIGKDDTKENPIDSMSYTNPKYDYAYAFNGSTWQWTSKETKSAENQFDELLSGQIKKDKTIYAGIYANFEVKADNKAEHFTWNFGDGHKSYLKKTRHKYEDSGIYLASLKLTGEGEDNLINFEVEVTKYLAPKIKIVKIKANPKGKDTLGEEIYLKNISKKKVNLKTWSIATGSKTLYNHPITQDFVIKPGKTKKITHKYSLFTLNNKKGAIELRYPNGEVASRVKYDKKKETVKDDEVYELSGKKWQWNAPPEEVLNPENISPSEENTESTDTETDLEISDEEISLNLGKYSSENKLALAEIKFTSTEKPLLQSRETPGIVLGAFSARDKIHTPVEIKSINSWQKTLQKSNQFFNLLINQLLGLI